MRKFTYKEILISVLDRVSEDDAKLIVGRLVVGDKTGVVGKVHIQDGSVFLVGGTSQSLGKVISCKLEPWEKKEDDRPKKNKADSKEVPPKRMGSEVAGVTIDSEKLL